MLDSHLFIMCALQFLSVLVFLFVFQRALYSCWLGDSNFMSQNTNETPTCVTYEGFKNIGF